SCFFNASDKNLPPFFDYLRCRGKFLFSACNKLRIALRSSRKYRINAKTNHSLPMKITLFVFMLLSPLISHSSSPEPSHEKDFYELRIYHIENPDQEKRMDTYLEEAFLPALHRFGIAKVGVFKPLLSDQKETGSKIYVFIPYTSMEQFLELPAALEKNREY